MNNNEVCVLSYNPEKIMWLCEFASGIQLELSEKNITMFSKQGYEFMDKCKKGYAAQAIVANMQFETNTLACTKACPAYPFPVENVSWVAPPCKQEEKECDMDTRTEAQQAKEYLIKSLDQTIWNKKTEAETTFNLKPYRPATVKELRDAIKNGFFSVPETIDDKTHIYHWQDYVTLQDPSKLPNPEGYEVALKKINKDASDVKDQIVVMGPEKGLEALNAFKAQTYN